MNQPTTTNEVFISSLPPVRTGNIARRARGFSMYELMVTLGLMGVIAGLAAPSYLDAVEKRQITNGAEQITAFVSMVQGESIKRNRMATVSYASQENGSWCIGAVMGTTACDCMEVVPTEADFCALDSVAWILSDADVQAKHLVSAVSGDGAYVFDPIRGMFIDPTDMLVLSLNTGGGQYQMNLSVISTGKVAVCLPSLSNNIPGFAFCPQQL